MNRGPDMVAWEALREQQYSPREAARAADIVVQALRKNGLLKDCSGECDNFVARVDVDGEDRKAFIAAMAADLQNLDRMDRLARGFDETSEGGEG